MANNNLDKVKNHINASRIEKAKDIAGQIFELYSEDTKYANWDLDKATDAIYSYIKQIEQS